VLSLTTQRARRYLFLGQTSRHDQIISAAASIIANKGYSRTSLQEIADKVKLRKQSLYHYFKSKAQIFYEILHVVISEGLQNITRIRELPIDPAEKLRRVIYWHAYEFYLHENRMKVYIQGKWDVLGGKCRRELRSLERQYDGTYCDILQEGVASGTFRADLDVHVVEFVLVGIIYHMAKWYSPQGRLTIDQIVDNYVALLFKGLLTPESQESLGTKGLGS
jgi:AcrR family transcriptional regulator